MSQIDNDSAKKAMHKVHAVAARLGVSDAFVYGRIADGTLRHYRLGNGQGCVRVSEEQLQEFLARRSPAPAQGQPTKEQPMADGNDNERRFVLYVAGSDLVIEAEVGGAGRVKVALPRSEEPATDSLGELLYRASHRAALDTIEAVALSHACAGIDISDPRYVSGLNTALEEFANRR